MSGEKEMQVVYERKDSYDLNSGPFGYVKVGFRYGDGVTWMGVCGSYLDNGKFPESEAFVKELVKRWNSFSHSFSHTSEEKE